jgi:hypothetical protein
MTEAYQHFERSFNKNEDNTPFSTSDIEKLEKELEIKLPTDYGMFLIEHGNLYTPEILDLIDDKQLDVADIQNIWTVERILHDKANEWTSNLEEDLIPFASDCMGNVFAFKRADILERKMNAPVYFYDHDYDTIEIVCGSFKALIERYNGLKE